MTFATLPLPAFPVGMTLCSGIGAPEVAAPWIDWRFASEIEPFPRAVLRARFGYQLPEDHRQGAPLLWGDMATVTPAILRAYGLPLPDILVAGTPCQAFSLAGSRGGLADARGNLTLSFVEICHAIQDASPTGRLLAVWENVPGVLSMRDNAFGCLLGGIVGGEPFAIPGGGKWPSIGMVSGPRGRAAWRVLDAQYFGCAQRRKRVFLVASLGAGPDPAGILFESAGGGGHPAPGGRAQETGAIAPTLSARTNGGGGLGADFDLDGGLVVGVTGCVAHTLTAEGFDTSEDGTGRGSVIVAASSGNVAMCLNAGGGGRLDLESETFVAGASPEYFVRRLTAPECHVLQGFPLDHCRVAVRGKPAAAGPQQKALGNSMAVPVMRWILDRARGVDAPLAAYDFEAARAAAWCDTCSD